MHLKNNNAKRDIEICVVQTRSMFLKLYSLKLNKGKSGSPRIYIKSMKIQNSLKQCLALPKIRLQAGAYQSYFSNAVTLVEQPKKTTEYPLQFIHVISLFLSRLYSTLTNLQIIHTASWLLNQILLFLSFITKAIFPTAI